MALGALFTSIRARALRRNPPSRQAVQSADAGMADPRCVPLVRVQFQCVSCDFKVTGTPDDVEIARRAHRHQSFRVPGTESADRENLKAKYFQASLLPRLTGTARLPQPYPLSYIWASILTALFVTAGGALLSRWLVDAWYPAMGGWIHGAFMLLIVGALLYALLKHENDRRGAHIHRFRVLAECNHHIRNALQVLVCTHEEPIPHPSLEVKRQISEAVHRIELTLSEVFPEVL